MHFLKALFLSWSLALDWSIEMENNGSGDAYSRRECICASVKVYSCAPPVSEFCKQVFYLMAEPVRLSQKGNFSYSTPSRGNAGLDVSGKQHLPEPVCIITLTSFEFMSIRQNRQPESRFFIVNHLPFWKKQAYRLSLLIADYMQFWVQAALYAAGVAGNISFSTSLLLYDALREVLLRWWCVEALRLCPKSCMRPNTLIRRQSMKRKKTILWGAKAKRGILPS